MIIYMNVTFRLFHTKGREITMEPQQSVRHEEEYSIVQDKDN